MSKAPKRLHERRYITTSQPKTTRYEPPKFEDVDDDTWSTNLESPSIVFPIDTSSKPKLGATGILAAGEDGKLTTPRYSAIDPLRHLNADQNWKLKELKQASARFRSSGPMDQEEMLQLAEMKMQKTCQRIIWSNGQKIMHRNTQKANQGNTHDNKPDAPERQQSAASSVESMTSSVYSESDIAANGDSSSCNGKSRAEAESDEKAYTEASSVDPADNVRSSHPLISQVKRWMSSNKSHKSLDPNRGSIDKPPVLPESNIEGIFDEWIKPDDSISSVVPAALNVRREPVHHD
jgi:hypothetical protein